MRSSSATKAASDTVLAKIIRMVGDAHARRAPVEQWVAKFARIYTPIVMALAIAIALLPPLIFGGAWDYWFYNALVLLVIACPCALVISTPVSIVAALTASARAGVLIKGGAYVEAPGRTTALAMDKTGTITMGQPEVAAVHPLGGASAQDLMTLAAGLEARSSHPLARAILARAEADGIKVSAAEDTRTVPGRGLEGRTDGRSIWLGSDRFAEEKGFGDAIPKDLRDRIAGIHPGCEVRLVEDFLTEDNASQCLALDDLSAPLHGVLDCCDQVRAKAAIAAWGAAQGVPVVSVGAAGGKRRPELVEVADLAEVTHDPLLASVRQRLRQRHGAPRRGGMGLRCVFSREPVRPSQEAACDTPAGAQPGMALACHGYGSSVMVTASFGMVAAAQLLNLIAES